MTTTTDGSVDFERAEALHRVVRSSVDAKLDVKAAIDSGIVKDMLHALVGIGLLSAAQARALWEAFTGGTFMPLPVIPWPESGLEFGLYDAIRAKLDRAPTGAGEIDVSAADVAHVLVEILHGLEAVGHAAASLWHWIFD